MNLKTEPDFFPQSSGFPHFEKHSLSLAFSLAKPLLNAVFFSFQSYMEDHLKNKNRLEKEWEALCAYQAEPNESSVAQQEENVPKNRSRAVVPCMYTSLCILAFWLFIHSPVLFAQWCESCRRQVNNVEWFLCILESCGYDFGLGACPVVLSDPVYLFVSHMYFTKMHTCAT